MSHDSAPSARDADNRPAAPTRPRPNPPLRRRSLWRLVARDLLLVPLLLAAALATLWVWRVAVIETVGPWALEMAGLGPARLSVVTLSADRLILADVALGGETLVADRVTLGFSRSDLAGGGLGPVVIEGLSARADWTPERGLDLGPLTPLLAHDNGADSPAASGLPPLPWVEARDARLIVTTPWGPARAIGDVSARLTGPVPTLAADVTAGGAGVYAVVTVSATGGPHPAVTATLETQAEARDRPGLAAGLRGSASLRVLWRNDGLEIRARTLDLNADAIDPDRLATLPPVLAALAEGPISVRLTPPAGAEAARLRLPLGPALDAADPVPRLDGHLTLRTDRLRVAVDAHLQTRLAIPGSTMDALKSAGGSHLDLTLAVEDLAVPGLGTLAEARASGRLTLSERALTWRADAPARASLKALDSALAGRLVAVLGRAPADPLLLRLGSRAGHDGAWSARLAPVPTDAGGPGWRLSLAGALRLADADGLTVEAAADIATDGPAPNAKGGTSATLSNLKVTATGLGPVGLSDLGATLSSDRITLAGGRVSGLLNVRAAAERLDHPILRGGAPTLTARGRLDWPLDRAPDSGLLTLDAATISLDAPSAGDGGWVGPERLTLTLEPSRPHVAAWHHPAGSEPGIVLDMTLAPVALAGTVSAVAEGVRLAGRLPATETLPFEVSARLPEARTTLGLGPVRDARARLRLTPAGPTLTGSGRLARLPGEEAPASGERNPLRPLRVSGTLRPDPDSAERLSLSFTVGAPLRADLARATGWMRRDGQAGRLRLTTQPLPLGGPGGVQPWHLHGTLVDLSASAGTLAMDGTVAWRDGGPLRPDLTVGLADVDAAYGATGLRQINGTIRLTGFSPPRSPVNELVAAELSMGLPFTDLSVRFRLDGGGDGFVLEQARMRLAGGEITTGPASIPLDGFDRVPLTLTVSGLDLAALAAMTPIADLAMTGTIDGTVPMVITPGAVRIDAGRLAAIGPGQVRYAGEALPEGMQGVDLARKALRNFEYRDLSMNVDGGSAEDMTLGLRLEGSNADVLDGYPFQLNLTVTGPLSRMVQDSLQGYTIPQRIAERLRSLGLQ